VINYTSYIFSSDGGHYLLLVFLFLDPLPKVNWIDASKKKNSHLKKLEFGEALDLWKHFLLCLWTKFQVSNQVSNNSYVNSGYISNLHSYHLSFLYRLIFWWCLFNVFLMHHIASSQYFIWILQISWCDLSIQMEFFDCKCSLVLIMQIDVFFVSYIAFYEYFLINLLLFRFLIVFFGFIYLFFLYLLPFSFHVLLF